MPEEARGECARILTEAFASGRNLPLNINLSSSEDAYSTDLRQAIVSIVGNQSKAASPRNCSESGDETSLPNIIRFPYSRHSSYAELCHLVDAFRPRDVWPCTFHLEAWQSRGELLTQGCVNGSRKLTYFRKACPFNRSLGNIAAAIDLRMT